nr:ribonuclease H-like domain-containing protein [Tanacetum cinerariifolium]
MAEDDENATNPLPVPTTPQAFHTLSTIKHPILKKGEYDIWAMKMEHYLGHTDYPIWEVIQKGNGHVQVSIDTHGQIRVLPPKTAEEILARARERKARTTLLIAKLEDHLAKFHKITNGKEMWERDYTKFTIGFKAFRVNLRFLVQVSPLKMPIRSFLGLYLFPSPNTNSTNEISTVYGVSTSSGHNSQKEGSSSYTDELMYSFFANQSIGIQLDHEDLEQRGRSKGNQESRRKDAGNTRYKERENERRPAKQDEHKAMVNINGKGVDWTGHAEDDTENYALIAFNSSNSGSDTEVTTCSKVCEESYAKLKKLYDEQREQLGDASIEIQAYTLALKKTLLTEAEKEKEKLKTKLDNFQSSSKGLSKLLNSQMSAKDKSGLGQSSDVEDSPVNDRFAKVEGMHAVPPPMTGI